MGPVVVKGASRQCYCLAMCVVRGAHPCCGSCFWSVRVLTVVGTNNSQHTHRCQVPLHRFRSEHPANAKVCMCTQNAVHAFFAQIEPTVSPLFWRAASSCAWQVQLGWLSAIHNTTGCICRVETRTDFPSSHRLAPISYTVRVHAFSHCSKQLRRFRLSPSFTLRLNYCGSIIDALSRACFHIGRACSRNNIGSASPHRIAPRHVHLLSPLLVSRGPSRPLSSIDRPCMEREHLHSVFVC